MKLPVVVEVARCVEGSETEDGLGNGQAGRGVHASIQSGTAALGEIGNTGLSFGVIRSAGLASRCFHEVLGMLSPRALLVHRTLTGPQDLDIPVALGRVGAMWVSGLLHVGTVALLAALPSFATLGWPYWAGWAAITGVLAYEHWLVRPDDLSKIDKAFFDLNGYVSLLFLAAVLFA